MYRAESIYRNFVGLIAAALAVFGFDRAMSGQTYYAVIDLGTLPGGTYSTASAINNKGEVVGTAATSNGFSHAFLWSRGKMTDLGTLGGSWSAAYDINDSSQVVGASYYQPNYPYAHGFLYSGGTMSDLGNFGGSALSATAINNNGDVVGYYSGPYGPAAVLYSGGHWTNILSPLFSYHSYAYDINSVRHIVLDVVAPSNGFEGAYDYDYNAGIQTPVGYLGGPSHASAINESGQIVGWSQTNGAHHAFLYSGGQTIDLGTLSNFVSSSANAINKNGQVVGSASGNVQHAFLYTNGVMVDLKTLVPNSGWDLTEAVGINDRGEIIGNGYNPLGQSRAFLLSFCPVGPITTDEASCEFPVRESSPPLDPLLLLRLTDFKSRISSAHGTYEVTCGWRSSALQAHFFEIKTKFIALRDTVPGVVATRLNCNGNIRPQLITNTYIGACQSVLDQVNSEICKHQLKPSKDGSPAVAPVGSSAHERGLAVDMNVSLPANSPYTIDQLAIKSRLYRPYAGDDVHFEMSDANPPRRLLFAGHSPIQILVTDPAGRRVGLDPGTGTEINQIGAFASYSGSNSTPQFIEILPNESQPGNYIVSGIGTAVEPYSITVQISDEDSSEILTEKPLASGTAQSRTPLSPIPPIDCTKSSMQLAVQQTANGIILTGPPWTTNYTLEYSNDLTIWSTHATQLDRTNGLVLTNPTGATFFRLRSN